MADPTSKARAWAVTINNWLPEDLKLLQDLVEAPPKPCARYCVAGKETGDSGTPHLQVTINFFNAKTFSAVKAILPRGAHIERCIALYKSCVYCKKDGVFEEWGTAPISNEAKGGLEVERYKVAWETAKRGDLEDIDADIRMRLYGTIKRIREDYQSKPDSLASISGKFLWFVGPSGSGKSKKAHADNPGAFLKAPNKWWDGYEPGDTVIIDEWAPCHHVLASHLKRWCDHHPFAAEVKGGSRILRPDKVIITSNYSIRECFHEQQDYEPLERRFKVVHFGDGF